ncbi:MAG: DNA-binding protein, partial [Anaerolineae bacterium]
AEGAPFEHYGPLQSQEAIQYAREIMDFVRAQMA